MRATFQTMEIARRALFTAQTQLDVTAHNIANVDTTGYTRQRAVVTASSPAEEPFLWETQASTSVGTGVQVDSIESMRDRFLQAQILREESRFGRAEARNDLFKQVEDIFNATGESNLKANLERFWQALQDTSQNTGSLALRGNLRGEAQGLTDFFRDMASSLKNLQGQPESVFQGSIQDRIDLAVQEVNKKGAEVAQLNVKIESLEAGGFNANDLRDRRDQLIEEISKVVNVERITSKENGHLFLRMGTHLFVQHGEFRQLYFKQKENNGPGVIVGGRTRVHGEVIDPGYPEFSSDPTVAQAQLTGVADLRNNALVVEQTATRNEKFSYLSFNPNKNSLSSFGIFSGTFSLNGKEYEIDAENTSVDQFVTKINDLDAGVVASLNEAGQVIFKSQRWGEEGNIDFQDGTSNVALILNMTDSVRGRNAIFNFGDQHFERSSNFISDAIPGVYLELKKAGVTQLDLRPIVTGGQLKGLLEMQQGAVEDLLSRLDKLAYELINEVNYQHMQGYGLDGQGGRNFFAPFKEVSEVTPWKGAASAIDLADEIKNDLNTIAASKGIYANPTDRLKTWAGASNGDNLIEIASLRFKLVFNQGQSNFDDFYDEMVSEYATESSDADQLLSYETAVREQLSTRRDSVSGVSLDEELANTIKFQQAYNAAARMVRMVDELLEVIIKGI